MATAFLPIFGHKFEWVGLHWTTGVTLPVVDSYRRERARGLI
jgi:hypothetical protein